MLYPIERRNSFYRSFVNMCGVAAKWRTSDLNVTGLRPPLATRHIRYVLLVNRQISCIYFPGY